MSDQTDVEVHDVELAGEALLDVVDARTAVAYEAGVWRDLRGATLTRRRKREMEGADADAEAEAAQGCCASCVRGHAEKPRRRQGEECGDD